MEPLQERSDETLCGLAAAGDRLAEECLALRYTRLVRVCARPYYLVGGDSEDLLQEGMIGLLSAIRGYSPDRGTGFRTYAETCIRNRLNSAIRAAAGKRNAPLNASVSISPMLEEGSFPGDGGQADPEDVVIGREEFSGRMKALREQLSRFEEKALDLYLSGLSYGEIAARTGRSQKSVDNAVQRIRRKAWSVFDPGDISAS